VVLYLQGAKDALRVHKLLDNLGRSPLHAAASANTVSIRFDRLFVDSGQEDKKMAFSSGGRDGMTPLHLAVKSGNMGVFRYMIQRRGDLLRNIGERDIWGREAIHIAASRGSSDVTKELLLAGSLPDRVDLAGKSPVDYLLHSKPEDEDDEQAPGSDDGRPGLSSENVAPVNESKLEDERCTVLQQFAAAKPDYRNLAGQTFLHIAAQLVDAMTIRKLISSAKMEIDEQDSQKRTPLHCALIARNEAVAITLIDEFGSSLSAKDANGTSVLMFAVSGYLLDVATRFLLEAKKRHQLPNEATKQLNEKQTTPAETKYEGGKSLAVCKVDSRDSNQRTALHYAVAGERLPDGPDLIKRLIEEGCDPSARDSDGLTALHLALKKKDEEPAVSYFFSLAELPQIQRHPTDKKGTSLLIAACRSNSMTAIKPILDSQALAKYYQ